MSSLKGTTCSCLILREKDKVAHNYVSWYGGKSYSKTTRNQGKTTSVHDKNKRTEKKEKMKKMPLWKKDVLWFVWVKNSR